MRNIPSLLLSISVTRDRSFRSPPKIGHDLAKQPVTIDRNHRSRLSEMTGHDAPKYANLPIEVQQPILDELAGAIQKKTITQTNISFTHGLVKAFKMGGFNPNLGLAILAARHVTSEVRANENLAKNSFVLDPECMRKGEEKLAAVRNRTVATGRT
jgi:hypothetical protein